MKDFMFIFRGPRDLKLTAEESQTNMQKWLDWIGQLSSKGSYLNGAQIAKEGKTIRGENMVVTDGPFTEGKELMGGYGACSSG